MKPDNSIKRLIEDRKYRRSFFEGIDTLIDLARSNGWYDTVRIHATKKRMIEDYVNTVIGYDWRTESG